MDHALGIADGYHDVNGTWHDTPGHTRELFRQVMGEPQAGPPMWFVDQGATHGLQGRCAITLEDGTERGEFDALPGDLPIGYHQLRPVDGGPTTLLVVAPAQCPPALRGWGVAAQVYSLWRPDGWGIGDLRDVEQLGQAVAARQGSAVLLSPLHAPSPTRPQEASPYYPSSRRWLNPLHIPMPGEAPVGVDNSPGGMIDRDIVWGAKRRALAQRFQDSAGDLEWRGWARAQGTDLWRFCTWNALADRHGAAWRSWPAELQHPDSPAVLDLPVQDHLFAADCEFHAWLQWLADRELDRAAHGAGVALIGDLAVGCSSDGADAWMFQDLMALGMSIGAPPDPFNAAGQDWGLPPFIPWRLRAAQYAPFIAMVRSACRHMGGLRIDHVMGLFRQYWIPNGGSPADGAYVHLPAHELLAIIRIEAVRSGAFVVGEDLGTVEPHVREALRSGGILGTKVWWFDTDAAHWAEPNLATVTTHDLPTVAGVHLGSDGSDEMQHALHGLSQGDALAAAVDVHRAVAQSPSQLVLATTDDLAGMVERPNHPGTTNAQEPNWCRRLPLPVDALFDREPGASIVAALRDARVPQG
ncbi:MAG: 4-alpha-glucanotransferase [Ilumatobacteraceae bacterium]